MQIAEGLANCQIRLVDQKCLGQNLTIDIDSRATPNG